MDNSQQLVILKMSGDRMTPAADLLAVEEPLEIRLAFGDQVKNLAVTMRTPGNDVELAIGFLFTEGIIGGIADVARVEQGAAACSQSGQNTILVRLAAGVKPNLQRAERNFYTTSSCGVCGKASIEAIRTVEKGRAQAGGLVRAQAGGDLLIDPSTLLGLPDRLSAAQEVFAATGGLHAAAMSEGRGELLLVREDVGRHNAVDKLIGAALAVEGLPIAATILLLSGRASFELVQKAAMAGIPVIAAVGAPSSLAVSLAEEFGITLVGFLREDRFNIYSGAHRIAGSELSKSTFEYEHK